MSYSIETRVIEAHIPLRLAERLDRVSARTGHSQDWIIRQALAAWMAQEDERSHMTHAALVDVESGRVIGQQTVQAWADSLSTATPLPVPR